MTAEEKKAAQEAADKAAQEAADKNVAAAPTGKGKFSDVVTVTGSKSHPTLPNKAYKVHRSQVDYLTKKGYIQKTAV